MCQKCNYQTQIDMIDFMLDECGGEYDHKAWELKGIRLNIKIREHVYAREKQMVEEIRTSIPNYQTWENYP